MFHKIKEYFLGKRGLETDGTREVTNEELQIAVSILLLQIAGSDDDYAPEEVETIFRLMEKEFEISQEEVRELLEVADLVRRDASKIDGYFKAINENFDLRQKQLIYSMLWRVVTADGKIEKFESRFATQVKFRLQLTDAQVEEAKSLE